MLAFAALDGREVVHQFDIDEDGLTVHAGAVAALHLAAGLIAGVTLSRAQHAGAASAGAWHDPGVRARSVALFVAAAVAEIGGAYLVWPGIKDHRGVLLLALGAMALTAYGVVAAF
jgi:hypothetical protein